MSAPIRPGDADVQAIVDRGFGSLAGARFLLLRVVDGAAARQWLASLAFASLAQAKTQRLDRVRQVAFTAAGLGALGMPPADIAGFAPEFVDGLAGNPSRSRRLGDTGPNAPEHWLWGGAAETEPHILLMLLASADDIAAFEAETLAAMPAAACTLLLANASNGTLGREPFGFADGLSQPEFDWDDRITPGGAPDRIYRNRLKLGELLLGHANEYGFVADYPQANGLGLNGSYLVYRQIEQDVTGFWRWLADVAGENGAMALAETMLGRRADGDPLPGLDAATGDFTFGSDPDGRVCPVGAHIRRANPRSGDDPNGRHGFFADLISSLGLKGTPMHDAVASARFHRLVRRGRAYGPMLAPLDAMRGSDAGAESGLHFVALNASLSRQFEFVQGAWVASAYFAGLSGEQDPLIGGRMPDPGGRATDAFHYCTAQGDPRLLTGLPRFVTVKGGAYFFLPGLGGLAWILNQ